MEHYIEIPEEVIDVYRTYRPAPLNRARQLEKELGLPEGVKIFYKYEGVSPAGSHKPNTAIPQAFYNKQEGIKRITTETGAGQWGSALSIACALYDMESRSTWWASPTSRSRTAASSWRPTAPRSSHRRRTAPTPGATCSTWTPTRSAASASRSPKRWKTPRCATTPLLRSAACSTTSACTRPSSAKRPSCRWRWPGRARRRHRVHRRRLELRRTSPSRTTSGASRVRPTRVSWRSSRRPARRSPPASTATTSAMRPA
jgi:hypothetical protein